ncbi:EAL domain-containing protein [Selenihalanaerobacter shriftii]|uniref:Diguanylate cyclase (GGDEF) domain-containing protein n=1 Tax=Selenihalanaerobacter shriftii TaxID=142842 RepID=A0A1T4JKP7_9FIRM|nr:EAL domain-containing protein [Selenihalanaerobacter shriftii]SJZ30712.1 diguanylate cyclase (GGDEF) domain-containing protein [Selenihalanaerobacter shriftii]
MFNKVKGLVAQVFDKSICSDLKANLTDDLTGLPIIPVFYNQLHKHLMQKKNIGIVYLDIINFSKVEEKYGQQVCEEVLVSVSNILDDVCEKLLRSNNKIGISNRGGDDFIIFLAGLDDEQSQAERSLNLIANRIKSNVVVKLNEIDYTEEVLDLHLGYTVIMKTETTRIEKVIYKAIREAEQIAKDQKTKEWMYRREMLNEIIDQENIRIVYQPLISLQTAEVIGYEALTRGPRGSCFERPDRLFNFAKETDLLLDLERLCRRKALVKANKFLDGRKLSLNVSPEVIEVDDFKKGITQKIISELKINNQDIIFEITEKTAITNFKIFRKTLNHYSSQGYQIAVDDLGAGYANLQTIAELHPQYIKLDMSLVRDINSNPTKEALLEAIVNFAHQVDAKVVGEGIETYDELERLIELGVDYGQGYLIQPPLLKPKRLDNKLKHFIKWKNKELNNIFTIDDLSIGNIIRYDIALQKDDLVEEVVNYFERNQCLNGIVVVDEEDSPIGLIMKDKLYNKLGKRFGVPLFMQRSVELVMDKNPLIIEEDISIEEASRMAMSRGYDKIYDYIIVTKNRKYEGTISVRRLLEKITNLQLNTAQNSNPLTGLPGNTLINQRLGKMLDNNLDLAILYIDLDNFKVFNDYYSFESGDLVIKLVANILTGLAKEKDFIGHIGGDDFLMIIEPKRVKEVAERIIAEYEKEVKNLNLNGNLNQPTISIAVVKTIDYNLKNQFEVGRVAAQLKDKVKRLDGSNYLINID